MKMLFFSSFGKDYIKKDRLGGKWFVFYYKDDNVLRLGE